MNEEALLGTIQELIKENKKLKQMFFASIQGIKYLKESGMAGLNTIERMSWSEDVNAVFRAIKIVELKLNGVKTDEIINIIEKGDEEKFFDDLFK